MRIFIKKLSLVLFLIVVLAACQSKKMASNKSSKNSTDSSLQYIVTDVFISAKRNLYQGDRDKAAELFYQCIKMDPKHDAARYELARMYENINPNKSIDFAKSAIFLAPDNLWYKEFLLGVYQQKKDYESAIIVIKKLIEQQPTNKDYYYQWANLCINSKDYNQAIKAYDNILQKFGYEEGVLKQQKQIYLKQGDLKNALAVLEQLSEHDPNNKEYYGMIAEIYLNMNKPEMAIHYYQKILTLDPEDGFVHFALADYYYSIHEKSKSFQELELGMGSENVNIDDKMKVLLKLMDISKTDSAYIPNFERLLAIAMDVNGDEPKLLALKADYTMQQNKVPEAILIFRQILSIDSSKFVIWEQLLLAEELQMDYIAMRDESNRALHMFPQQASLYYFSALAYSKEGNWQKCFERAKMGSNFVYEQVDMASFMALRAKAEMQLEDPDNSIANYRRAIQLDPNNSEIKKDFAFSLAVHNLELTNALAYAKQALELNGDDPEYIYVYAYCLFKNGQKEDALKWLNPALKQFPDNHNLRLLDMEINKE